LFFTPEDDSREFSEVLREVQGYIAANYSSLMTGSGDSRDQIRRYAAKYIQDKRIAVKGMTSDELVDAIYSEMAEYGFLTKYIFGEGIEEIDINHGVILRCSILAVSPKNSRAF
jgi:pilus assembly protein CpaF